MRTEMASLLETASDASSIDRIVSAFWTTPRDRNAVAKVASLAAAREKSTSNAPR
jgi:hypothetical protein